VTRAGTWSLNRSLEWARRPGASLPKRMSASWSGPAGPTEYKFVARALRASRRAPLGSFVFPNGDIATKPKLPKCYQAAHAAWDEDLPDSLRDSATARGPIGNRRSRPGRTRRNRASRGCGEVTGSPQVTGESALRGLPPASEGRKRQAAGASSGNSSPPPPNTS